MCELGDEWSAWPALANGCVFADTDWQIETCQRSGLDKPQLEDLCCLATGSFPHSGPLWLLRLKCCACRVGAESEGVVALFRQSVQLVPVSSSLCADTGGKVHLWHCPVLCRAVGDVVPVPRCELPVSEGGGGGMYVGVREEADVRGLDHCPSHAQLARQCVHEPVRVRVSVMYLEWSLLSEGIAATRRTYQK